MRQRLTRRQADLARELAALGYKSRPIADLMGVSIIAVQVALARKPPTMVRFRRPP